MCVYARAGPKRDLGVQAASASEAGAQHLICPLGKCRELKAAGRPHDSC
jgi:hypothetical protein